MATHTFTVSLADVQKYGLYAPLTFVFSIPEGAKSLSAWYKYNIISDWNPFSEKDSSDFFNALECVRFEYGDGKAYVSAGFEGHSKLYIGINGENSELCEFLNVAQYYDGRKAVVTSSHDDWSAAEVPDFTKAMSVFRKYHVWFTVGVIAGWAAGGTNNPNSWPALQQEVDKGYVDVASHSADHFYLPDGTVDPNPNQHYQAGKSRDYILGNLSRLPYGPYVPIWIEPFGNAWWPQTLSQYNYLFSRSTSGSQMGLATYSSSIGMYNRYGMSIEMGTWGSTNLDVLNDRFNQAYSAGGVYHVMTHPYDGHVDWSTGGYADSHLQHISNRLDVWYVGLSGLYQYEYAKMKVQYSTPT